MENAEAQNERGGFQRPGSVKRGSAAPSTLTTPPEGEMAASLPGQTSPLGGHFVKCGLCGIPVSIKPHMRGDEHTDPHPQMHQGPTPLSEVTSHCPSGAEKPVPAITPPLALRCRS